MEASVATAVSHPTFGTTEKFLDYLETHLESPKALTLCKHIIQLIFLADEGIDQLERSNRCYFDCYCFDSLHNFRTTELISHARARIEDGKVQDDWHERLLEIIT